MFFIYITYVFRVRTVPVNYRVGLSTGRHPADRAVYPRPGEISN